jgi:uncharacterized membrane protein YphA (DoxX/SURF4 family)
MNSNKKDKILYWVFTAPFCLILLMSSIFYLTGAEQAVEGFQHLGFPIYMLKILGVAKILGVMGILFGRFTTLKEWAYAGLTINLLGASAAHAFSGDDYMKCVMPLVFITVLMGSYFFWKKTSLQLVEGRV